MRKEVTSEVPQGSVFALVMILIYMNDESITLGSYVNVFPETIKGDN